MLDRRHCMAIKRGGLGRPGEAWGGGAGAWTGAGAGQVVPFNVYQTRLDSQESPAPPPPNRRTIPQLVHRIGATFAPILLV